MGANNHRLCFYIILGLLVFFLEMVCQPPLSFAKPAGEKAIKQIMTLALEGSTPESLDDLMEGFEDNTGEDETGYEELYGEDEDQIASRISLDGYLKLGAGYNFAHDKPEAGQTDHRGLSKLRGELQLELNLKFSDHWQGLVSGKGTYDAAYQFNGRKGYPHEVLGEYEDELELREAYIIGRLSRHLDVKVGRQIVVWGKSDTIRVVDVLNPLDLREPGLTDLEDLRLPLVMTKLDYYWGNWNLSGIAIHEIRFDKQPVLGSDFFPFNSSLPPEDKLSDGGDNTEYGVSLKGIFSGWDVSFFYADIFWDTPHVEMTFFPVGSILKHADVDMMGGAFNVALGNWIIKAEGAYIDGLKYFNGMDESYSRTDAMAGLEYYGFDDAVIILEVADRHVNGFDSMLKQPPDQAREDESQTVLRVSRTFLNETLELEALLSIYGFDGKDGGFQRYGATYDLTDAVEIKGGVLLYQSGDLPEFSDIGDNDRLFMDIKYSF